MTGKPELSLGVGETMYFRQPLWAKLGRGKRNNLPATKLCAFSTRGRLLQSPCAFLGQQAAAALRKSLIASSYGVKSWTTSKLRLHCMLPFTISAAFISSG